MKKKQLDLTLKELGILHNLLGVSLEFAEETDAPAPIIFTCRTVMEKVEELIDQECQIFNEFQELTTQLQDLYLASKILIKNPEAVTTDYE